MLLNKNKLKTSILLSLITIGGVFLFSVPGASAGANGVCTSTVTNITASAARLTWTTDGSGQYLSMVNVYSDAGYTNQAYQSGQVSNGNLYWDIPDGSLGRGTVYYWTVQINAIFGADYGWTGVAQGGSFKTLDTGAISIGRSVTFGQNVNLSTKWCPATFTDARDSKTYAAVAIGSQCWMKQGLNVGTRINGGTTQDGYSGTTCASIDKYCYDDTDANCDSSNNPNYPDGGLYQWNQAMCGATAEGAQGICPNGWHIPTHAEFCKLERSQNNLYSCGYGWLGTDAGTRLKANGSSLWEGNLSGEYTSSFVNRTTYGPAWSSSRWYDYDETFQWYYEFQVLGASEATVGYSFAGDPTPAYSIRCIKN